MDPRREALAKATITTTDAAAGLLDPTQSRTFIRDLKDKGTLSAKMRQEIRVASTGEINRIATGSRLIRAATENSDDGYRAGATFPTVSFATRKLRLPWEVTEDVFHENIEGQGLEATLESEMTDQFALDIEDLEVNGNTADVSGDAAFLTINDGVIKQVADANVAGRQVNASNTALTKAHLFDAKFALPNKYRVNPRLVWICSPNRALAWWESVVDRDPGSGTDLLIGENAGVVKGPLNIPFLEVPSWPDHTIMLADPRNFVRVISWQIRRRKVTGETDAELAATDKRFYVFFLKHDVIVENLDAIVRIHNIATP